MPWRIVCPPSRFLQLKSDPAFQRLLIAGKIANALRFAIVAAMARNGMPDGNTTIRTRAGSFLYVSGLVQEAFKFLPRLEEHYSAEPTFQAELAPLLRDAGIDSLRKGALARLRNKGVFHNDDAVMIRGLRDLELDEYILMAGDTNVGADVYFPVADIAVIHHALDSPAVGLGILRGMSDLLDQVATVGTQLCRGIDSLSQEVLLSLGCTYHDE